jgi:hypothetical protein
MAQFMTIMTILVPVLTGISILTTADVRRILPRSPSCTAAHSPQAPGYRQLKIFLLLKKYLAFAKIYDNEEGSNVKI